MDFKKELLIKLSIAGGLLLFAAASMLPLESFWGFNHLHFLGGGTIYYFLILSVIVIYLLFGPLPKMDGNRSFDKFNEFVKNKKSTLIIITALLFTTLFFIFRTPTFFLGDGYTCIENFAGEKGFIHKQTEFLSSYLIRWGQLLLGGYSKESSLLSFEIFSIFSGFIAVINMFFIVKYISKNDSIRWLSFLTLLFSGSILLYFGYVEFYPILWAFALTFFSLALRYLKTGKGLLLTLIVFVLTTLMHLQAIYLLGGVVVLMAFKKYNKESIANLPSKIYFMIGFIALSGLAVTAYLLVNHIGFRLLFLPPFTGWAAAPNYAMFSINHLYDILNLFFLIIPGGIALLLMLFLKRKDGGFKKDWVYQFLLMSSVGSILFLFVIDPNLGLGRDWDLMSLTLLSPVLLMLYHIGRTFEKIPGRIVIAYGLSCFIITGLFVEVNAKAETSENRYYTLLTNDQDNRSRNGWLILNNYYFGLNRTQDGERTLNEMNKRCPDYVLVNSAYTFMIRGAYPQALQVAERLLKKNRYNTTFLELMGNVKVGYKNYAEAEYYFKRVLSMMSYSVSTKNALASLYMAQGQHENALILLEEIYPISPRRVDIIENLASTYISLRDFEKATSLAVELFDRDKNSPSGHVIMMTIASSFGDDKKAKEHYSAFLDHGQEHQQYRQIIEYFKKYSE